MQTRRLLISSALASGVLAACDRTATSSLVFADVSRIWWNTNPIVAIERNLFTDQPFALSRFELATGRESLDAVIAGNADLGMSAASPLLFAAAAGRASDVRVVASVARSDGLVGIVSREPLDGSVPQGPIGFVPNTVSQYMLHLYWRSVTQSGMPASTNLVQARPADLPTQYANGAINSFVCWEPYPRIAELASRQSGRGETFVARPAGLYPMEFFLFTRADVAQEKRESIDQFIEVLRAASQWAASNSQEAKQMVSSATGLSPPHFDDLWSRANLEVVTDRGAILGALQNEARVASEIGVTEAPISMDFLVSS